MFSQALALKTASQKYIDNFTRKLSGKSSVFRCFLALRRPGGRGPRRGPAPFLPVSALNALRRELAGQLEAQPCRSRAAGNEIPSSTEDHSGYGQKISPLSRPQELLRSKYCIRHELGLCLRDKATAHRGALYLVNNGRRLPLRFDCAACEMAVLAE